MTGALPTAQEALFETESAKAMVFELCSLEFVVVVCFILVEEGELYRSSQAQDPLTAPMLSSLHELCFLSYFIYCDSKKSYSDTHTHTHTQKAEER